MSSDANHTITPTPRGDGARDGDSGEDGGVAGWEVTDTPAFVPEAGLTVLRSVQYGSGTVAEVADPSTRDLLLGWQLDPASLLLVGVTGAPYAVGVRRLAGRGRHWSPARTAALAGALAMAVLATQSGIARH